MNYEIIKDRLVPCKIISLEKKVNYRNEPFLLAKLGEYTSGRFLHSVILGIEEYDFFTSYLNEGKRLDTHLFTIKPEVPVYHIIDWDYVNAGHSSLNNLGEIERDENNNPKVFDKFTVYAEIENTTNPKLSLNSILQGKVIATNDPRVQNLLNYRNNYTRSQFNSNGSIVDDGSYPDGSWTDDELEEAADIAYEGYSPLELGLD